MNKILQLREELKDLRRDYCKGTSCLQFALNIPGPDKIAYPAGLLSRTGFDHLFKEMERNNVSMTLAWSAPPDISFTFLFKVQCSAMHLKKLLLPIEDEHPLGRYWDLDVFETEGKNISRRDLGHPERKCFICGSSAKRCSFMKVHSLKELYEKIESDVNNFMGVNRI